MKPEKVIEIVRERLDEIPTKNARAAWDKLEAQSRQLSTSRKRAATRTTKRKAKVLNRQSRALAKRLERQARTLEDQGYFDPKDDQDARERIAAEIVRRRGKEKFRAELLDAYGQRCAVTRCIVTEALEAAHIKPYKGPKTNHVTNGLLLRADIHTLFDLNLLGINPDSLSIALAPSLRGSSYKNFNGRVLAKTKDESQRPNLQALKQKWKEFQNAVRSSHG
jgi:predicted restriction endonuclease